MAQHVTGGKNAMHLMLLSIHKAFGFSVEDTLEGEKLPGQELPQTPVLGHSADPHYPVQQPCANRCAGKRKRQRSARQPPSPGKQVSGSGPVDLLPTAIPPVAKHCG